VKLLAAGHAVGGAVSAMLDSHPRRERQFRE
jgi:hypothetical protein